jgi:DNA-binding transcriptional MerR regulator
MKGIGKAHSEAMRALREAKERKEVPISEDVVRNIKEIHQDFIRSRQKREKDESVIHERKGDLSAFPKDVVIDTENTQQDEANYHRIKKDESVTNSGEHIFEERHRNDSCQTLPSGDGIRDFIVPVTKQEETSAYYKLYKEKDEEVIRLIKELTQSDMRCEQLEKEISDLEDELKRKRTWVGSDAQVLQKNVPLSNPSKASIGSAGIFPPQTSRHRSEDEEIVPIDFAWKVAVIVIAIIVFCGFIAIVVMIDTNKNKHTMSETNSSINRHNEEENVFSNKNMIKRCYNIRYLYV